MNLEMTCDILVQRQNWFAVLLQGNLYNISGEILFFLEGGTFNGERSIPLFCFSKLVEKYLFLCREMKMMP